MHMYLYLCAHACMHLDPREFAFTRINANAVSCVRLRACSRAGLIKKRKTRLRAKNHKIQTHFVFRNFQDVLYHVFLNMYSLLSFPWVLSLNYT